jgi:N-acetyl-anhydromuramyl-L-alanine amidase AmpD
VIPQKIIIHCSASPNGKRWDIADIRKEHIENRGFKDVGYHLVIQPDGECQNGRALNVEGAHCEGENHHSIGICLIGLDQFSQKQLDVLRYKIDSVRLSYNIPAWEIRAHYEFPSAQKQGKTCPNLLIGHLMHWYLTQEYKALTGHLSNS